MRWSSCLGVCLWICNFGLASSIPLGGVEKKKLNGLYSRTISNVKIPSTGLPYTRSRCNTVSLCCNSTPVGNGVRIRLCIVNDLCICNLYMYTCSFMLYSHCQCINCNSSTIHLVVHVMNCACVELFKCISLCVTCVACDFCTVHATIWLHHNSASNNSASTV